MVLGLRREGRSYSGRDISLEMTTMKFAAGNPVDLDAATGDSSTEVQPTRSTGDPEAASDVDVDRQVAPEELEEEYDAEPDDWLQDFRTRWGAL